MTFHRRPIFRRGGRRPPVKNLLTYLGTRFATYLAVLFIGITIVFIILLVPGCGPLRESDATDPRQHRDAPWAVNRVRSEPALWP